MRPPAGRGPSSTLLTGVGPHRILNHMVYSEAAPDGLLDAVFGALADPTRRAIVARLAQSETTVGELARPLPMSLPAVGKHLGVLERARLVVRWREGRVRRVRLTPAAMRGADAWLAPYRRLWDDHIDRLAVHLGEFPFGEAPSDPSPPARRPPSPLTPESSA